VAAAKSDRSKPEEAEEKPAKPRTRRKASA
jgi:hypothetical protein